MLPTLSGKDPNIYHDNSIYQRRTVDNINLANKLPKLQFSIDAEMDFPLGKWHLNKEQIQNFIDKAKNTTLRFLLTWKK